MVGLFRKDIDLNESKNMEDLHKSVSIVKNYLNNNLPIDNLTYNNYVYHHIGDDINVSWKLI